MTPREILGWVGWLLCLLKLPRCQIKRFKIYVKKRQQPSDIPEIDIVFFWVTPPPPYDDYSKVGLDFRASERGTACDSLP